MISRIISLTIRLNILKRIKLFNKIKGTTSATKQGHNVSLAPHAKNSKECEYVVEREQILKMYSIF